MTSGIAQSAYEGIMLDAESHSNEQKLDASEIALLRCIERIETIIELETQQLKNRTPADFDAFNDRKAYALFELTRLVRSMNGSIPSALLSRFQTLQTRLAENERLLAQNLRALGEITDVLVRLANAEASDGTYSATSASSRE